MVLEEVPFLLNTPNRGCRCFWRSGRAAAAPEGRECAAGAFCLTEVGGKSNNSKRGKEKEKRVRAKVTV